MLATAPSSRLDEIKVASEVSKVRLTSSPVTSLKILTKSTNTVSEIPWPAKTKIIIQIYFLSNLSLPPFVVDRYIPTIAKKNAIIFNLSKIFSSGYKISAAHTGII